MLRFCLLFASKSRYAVALNLTGLGKQVYIGLLLKDIIFASLTLFYAAITPTVMDAPKFTHWLVPTEFLF